MRLNRRTYIITFFASALPWVLISAIANVGNGLHGTMQNIVFGFFTFLIFIAVIYWLATILIASLNRVHDIGWHWIFVVIFGFLTPFLLILAVFPGQKVANKYGDIPSKNFDLCSSLLWWRTGYTT